MAFRMVIIMFLFTGLVRSGYTQSISFNTPLPWVSLRNDTIVVRAQIDTVALKNKKLSITLSTVKNGRSSKIAMNTYAIKDPSGEFSFGKIKKKLIGGEEFLQVKWAVKGTKDEGFIAPIGIADLSAQGKTDTVRVMHVADGAAINDVATTVGDKFQQTGKLSYAFAWNKNALFAVVKKCMVKDTLKFAFDGKSGKNAFLSYPDRIIASSVADSLIVRGVHYKRDMRKDSLVYTVDEWRTEMTHEVVGDKIVIRLPWYDTGMIPFEGRTIGFGTFVVGANGKTNAALPASAQLFIPATWGVMLLQK